MEFDGRLLHCPANLLPLSPVTFLKRAAALYGGRTSIIYGTRAFTWADTYCRCLKLASALVHHFHVSPGDLVAAMAPNIPEIYELHYAVPMAGAIISPLNTKLDSATLALLLHQLRPKIIFVDSQFLPILLQSLSQNNANSIKPAAVVIVIPTGPPEVPTYDGVLAMGSD
ncbi:butyrate--CoA ligase AAE11, peroxisomal, partial [Momordica charantia]|uniref:Butyrate--CoA ligase AAE11, peroxisomal n=1 Tax=Momordica charantia TaxID=3673 RepID=A0A6J1CVK6_MOMCH